MKVLGAMPITTAQQKQIAKGERVLDFAIASLLPRVRDGARVGHVMWVKEPFCELKSRRFARKQFHVMVPGAGPLDVEIPADLKQHIGDFSMLFHVASLMTKADSRATLEVTEITTDTMRCTVHLRHISTFERDWAQ